MQGVPPPPPNVIKVQAPTNVALYQPSETDIAQAMSGLKKPTTQHIVGFKERYQQALRLQSDDDFLLDYNRRFIFDNDTNSWKRYSCNDHHNALLSEMISFPKKLKIATLNVWFALILQEKRYPAQLQEFQLMNPDIICLQEMIPTYIEDYITKNDFIRQNYIISDIDGTTVEPYGVMMLVKKTLPLLDVRISKLTSKMGRKLIHAVFSKDPVKDVNAAMRYFESSSKGGKTSDLEKIIESHAVIGTVHLESLGSGKARKTQLEQIHPVLEFYTKSSLKMLMGDFNFGDEGKENEVNLKTDKFCNYKDVWPTLYPTKVKEGITHTDCSSRIDRVIIRSKDYEPTLMSVYGTTPLPLSDEEHKYLKEHFNYDNVNLSDHHGLYCEITKH